MTTAELDGAIIEVMRETGLCAAELGSDAPSDATLRGIGKDFLFRDVERCNSMFLDQGVVTAHYFMFGCPGETRETVEEGIANILSLQKAAIFVFMGIRILPDTGLVKIAVRDGLLREGQSLLEPTYYISPKVERQWMENALEESFAKTRHVVFPPDALDSKLQLLIKLGFKGSLWDLLVKSKAPRTRATQAGSA